MEFFRQGLLHWQLLLLLVINGLTTLITYINILFLHHSFSKSTLLKQTSVFTLDESKKHRSHITPNNQHESNVSVLIKSSPAPITPNRSQNISITKTPKTPNINNKPFESFNKNRVITYFYVVPWIPLFISYVAFYGAIFPEQAIWILPFVNIVIGFAFLTFINMMIMSCDGWFIVQHYLEGQQDICCRRKKKHSQHKHKRHKKRKYRNKCCLQQNAYKGLKFKIKLCYLILLSPLLNYATAYFQYYYNIILISYILKGLAVVTTIISIEMMKTIHLLLKPYSKISHTYIKMIIVICLSPLCQLQQAFIGFLFHLDVVPESSIFNNASLSIQYQWPILYGLIVCMEMFVISIIITWKAFSATDLKQWDKMDALMRSRGNSEISMNIPGVTVESDTDGSFVC